MSDASSSDRRPAISRRVWLTPLIIAVIGTAFGNKLGVTATALLMAAVLTWFLVSEYLSPGGVLRKASGVRWLRFLAILTTTIAFPLTIAATGRWMDLIGTLGLATAATIICIVLLIAGLGIGWRQAMLAPIGWTLGPLIALWGSQFVWEGNLQGYGWISILVGLPFLLGGVAVWWWGFTVLWGDQSIWCDAVDLGGVSMLMLGVLGLPNRAFLLSTALVLGGVALLLWSVAVRAGKQSLLGISAVLGGLGALLLGGWLILGEHLLDGVACICWGSLLLIWAFGRGLAAEIPKGIVAIPGGLLIFLMGVSSLLERQSFSGTTLVLVGIIFVINSVHHATDKSPQVRAWVHYLASRPVHPKRSAGSTSAGAASIPSPRRAIQGDRVSNFAEPAIEGDVDGAG